MPRPPRPALFACLAACLSIGLAGCSATELNPDFCCTSAAACAPFGVDQPQGCASGYACAAEINTCVFAGCGDGALGEGELCDDGNNSNGDACSADCQLPSCYVPFSHPTIQAAIDDPACTHVVIEPGSYTENLAIARDISLAPPGGSTVTIDGAGLGSVVAIAKGTVMLENLILRGGRALEGGGIHNQGALTLRGVRVEDNLAIAPSPRGGGIFSSGSLMLERTTVTRNAARVETSGATLVEAHGGGIFSATGSVVLDHALVTDNQVELSSGSLQLRGTGAVSGGGLASVAGEVTLRDSEVRGNRLDLTAQPGTGRALGGGLAVASGRLVLERTQVVSNTVTSDTNASGGGLTAATVLLSETTIADNQLVARGSEVSGGGAYVAGEALIERSEVRGNRLEALSATEGSQAHGGGLHAVGKLTIRDAKIQSNAVKASGPEHSSFGAGVSWRPSAASTLVVQRTSVAGNRVESFYCMGGGIHALLPAQAVVVIEQSSIIDNQLTGEETSLGAGLHAVAADGAKVAIVSSTLSGNSLTVMLQGGDAAGGALYARGTGSNATVELTSSTVARNHAEQTAGIHVVGVVGTLFNTLLVENQGPACNALVSQGYNVLTHSCALTENATDIRSAPVPQVLPLADNGGPTLTHALVPGSRALDAGAPSGCTYEGTLLAVDQRGKPRTNNLRCDVGAFEQ